MSYLDLAATLVGELPGLSPFLAENYITNAVRDVFKERLWSFLIKETAYTLPAQITAGTVTYTQFQTTVTLNAAASAAVTPYIAGTPLLTQMQIRFNGLSLYNITAVNTAAPTALVLTVDRAIQETGGTGIAYQVYRCYITAPSSDFLRWESFDDFQHGYAIFGDRLEMARRDFDRRDPQRQSQGQSFYVGENKGVVTSTPLYELWPHPTNGQTFTVTYRGKGLAPDFSSATDAQPPMIPDSLILIRAKGWYAYPWANVNKGAFPRFVRTDWLASIVDAKRQYVIDLNGIKNQDDEQALQRVYSRGRGSRSRPGLPGPADAKYWQSHPITW